MNQFPPTIDYLTKTDRSPCYQIVTEIQHQDRQYWIIYLNDQTDAINFNGLEQIPELNRANHTFSTLGRFEFNNQFFMLIEVLSCPKSNERNERDIAALLSARELQIATLVALGYANKQIAHQLSISQWTVSTYLKRIFAKLGVDSRAAMVYHCASLIQRLNTLETVKV